MTYRETNSVDLTKQQSGCRSAYELLGFLLFWFEVMINMKSKCICVSECNCCIFVHRANMSSLYI